MLTARFFLLLLLLQFSCFFRLWPWAFVWGLLTWPVYFVRMLRLEGKHKRHCVFVGARNVLEAEVMPAFIRRRIEDIYLEAQS